MKNIILHEMLCITKSAGIMIKIWVRRNSEYKKDMLNLLVESLQRRQ